MVDIDKILPKHFSGSASPEEESIVESWRVNNLKEYNALKEAWMSYDSNASHVTFDTDGAWQKVQAQIKTENRTFSIFSRPLIKYGIAAALLLLAGIFVLNRFWFQTNGKEKTLVFYNPASVAKSFVLPDGSTVWLNQFSKLEYIVDNDHARDMGLTGEAFFDVKRDTLLPFIVRTQQGTVTVLGTSFNVNSTDSTSMVSVKSGLVKLASGEQSTLLHPNETAIATHFGISEKSLSDPNFLSWKTGEFDFKDCSLPEIVKSLNTYYKNRFGYVNEELNQCRITAHFRNNSVEEIEQTILLVCSEVSSTRKGDKIIFK